MNPTTGAWTYLHEIANWPMVFKMKVTKQQKIRESTKTEERGDFQT